MIRIRDFEAATGEKKHGTVQVGEWADGSPVNIPIVVVNGTDEGPTLLALGAMHGDEVVGTEAIRRLAAELDPAGMRGAVIGILAANLPAFLMGTRVNTLEDPAGWNDLKKHLRTAQATGTLTERIAAMIRDDFVPLCDYYVDLHSSARGSVNYPRAIVAGEYLSVAQELHAKLDRLAQACDFEYVFKPSGKRWKGMYFEPAFPFEEDQGKAGIILETGYAPTMEGADVLVTAMRNILIETGILEGNFTRSVPLTFIERLVAVRANRGGMWHPRAAVPDAVAEGDLLGEIRDLSDNVVEEIRAPEAGIAIKVATNATVTTGVRAYVLGIPYGG